MSETLDETYAELRELLSRHAEGWAVDDAGDASYGLKGKNPTEFRGREQKDGMFFASTARRKNSIVFYFFPIYTHPNRFDTISDELRKALKGKSCFHFTKPDADRFAELDAMLARGRALYDAEGVV